ncbi:MAG: hypothetical protein ACT4PM_01835 [Gemmatimonadales bacterium]
MTSCQSWLGWSGTAIASVLALVTGCGPTATPPPRFGRIDGTSRGDLLAYAQSLDFDTARMAGDEQPLPIADSGRIVMGPLVRIEPERGAMYLTREQMGQGRIIARFRAAAAYPPLGIPAGDSYLWVDNVGDSLRQVIVPANESDSLRVTPLVIEEHDRAYFGPRPVMSSRWVITMDSVGCDTPCPRFGSCCGPKASLR